MIEFVVIVIFLTVYNYFVENPPAFVLNILAPRLHRKVLKKLEEFHESEKTEENDELHKELVNSIKKEIEEIKNTKDLVYKLISNYHDKGKNIRKPLDIWYKYLKIEQEYVDAWASGLDVMEYEDIRKNAILMDAYRKILKEWSER